MANSQQKHHHNPNEQRAFTLVEILLTIAIIAVLISLALYALKSVQRSAGRTASLNALRQMMTGYQRYSDENSGALMPGFINEADFAAGQPFENLQVRLSETKHQLTPGDASSYVWRLAPYLDNAWGTYMVDYRSAAIENRMLTEYSCGSNNCPPYTDPSSGTTYNPPPGVFGPTTAIGAQQLGIALRPSFAINSVYVGGDSRHCGDGTTNANAPWKDPAVRYAAVRQSEPRNPSRLIVFAAARAANSVALRVSKSVNVDLGYSVLIPPFATFDRDDQTPGMAQWTFDNNQAVVSGSDPQDRVGLPFDRSGQHSPNYQTGALVLQGNQRVPVAHLDGSVTSEEVQTLAPASSLSTTKMNRWSPFAVGNN